MKLSRLIMAAVALAGAALAAGCGNAPPTAGDPAASYAPDELVLRVRTAGGMVPVSLFVTGLPQISVYGDGRVITTGPVPEIYPGPALPNVQLRRISPADVRSLVKRALEAGVGDSEDLGTPNVADAPTTSIAVRTATGLATTDATALSFDDSSGLSGGQQQARKRLRDLVRSLDDLPGTLGKDKVSEPVAYEPGLIAAVAREWVPSQGGRPEDPPAIDWPAALLPGDPIPNRTGVHCLTTPAAPILAAARGANARTPWVSGATRWTVDFRPLLPGESTCADLAK
ncbi:hypothetical protein [Dactylosporangium sp. CA-233914]|uniref:hypothetical protein n=1 Tax=Dactylosporangium sp. CA-233914 TaxID=3239934 RepID=UPI003D92D4E1